jgi:hypothetical protein
MASEAGVSYVTMWKAVQLPGRAGAARRKPPRKPSRPVRSWERVKRRMAIDLLQGDLARAEMLPRINSLCLQYGAGYRSTVRALNRLVAESLIVRDGRSYRRPKPSLGAASLRIGFVTFVPHYLARTEPIIQVAEYDQDFMRSLELECNRSHVGVDVFGYRAEGGSLLITDALQKSRRRISSSNGIDGYVVPISLAQGVSPGLFEQLHAAAKPVVIVDQIGGWELPRSFSLSGRFLIIEARNATAIGRETATTVLAMGHRRCAYFSPFHDDPWSKGCLEGLDEVFSAAGHFCRIMPCVTAGTQIWSTPEIDAIVKRSYGKLRSGFDALRPTLSAAYVRQLDPFFGHLLGEHIVFAEVRNRLAGLYKAAIHDSSISCWIGATVEAAWFASDFLADRPARPSLVSLEWSPEITKRRIASYDYNIEAAARITIEHLIHPDRPIPGIEKGRLPVKGSVITRESLRRRSIGR